MERGERRASRCWWELCTYIHIQTRWMDTLRFDASNDPPKAFIVERTHSPRVNANISVARVRGLNADSEWAASPVVDGPIVLSTKVLEHWTTKWSLCPRERKNADGREADRNEWTLKGKNEFRVDSWTWPGPILDPLSSVAYTKIPGSEVCLRWSLTVF